MAPNNFETRAVDAAPAGGRASWYHAVIVSRALSFVLFLAPLLLACLGGCSSPAPNGPTERNGHTGPTRVAGPATEAPPPGYNAARRTQLADLPTAEVRIHDRTLRVWIASNSLAREEGMMHLEDAEVPDDHGMLFVFLQEAPLSFWMRNTLIPLDIAFLNAKGRVLNIEQMVPLDPMSVQSSGPAQFALEVKSGTFERYGLRPGDTVLLPPGISATD